MLLTPKPFLQPIFNHSLEYLINPPFWSFYGLKLCMGTHLVVFSGNLLRALLPLSAPLLEVGEDTVVAVAFSAPFPE